MPNREEIREEIIDWFLMRDPSKDRSWAEWEVKVLFNKLASAGLVIKVDSDAEQVARLIDSDRPFAIKLIKMLKDKVGYVAVKSLIEMCEHKWIKLRNEVITSGEICTKCKAIRPETAEPLIDDKVQRIRAANFR